MSYIPPHKRHLKDPRRPSPTPQLPVPQFNRNLNLRLPKTNVDRSGKIVYADSAINRWFAVDLGDDNRFPSSVHPEHISVEAVERIRGEKPLVLVNDNLAKDAVVVRGNTSMSPWETVAKNVWPDLLSSYATLLNEMEEKPALVARFGKVLFHATNLLSLESATDGQVTETTLRQLKRSFYTNLPSSYVEKITNEVVPKIGINFEGYKDVYHVRLSDSTRPNSTISCKCRIKEDKKLELYKVELNPVRHMIEDISCLAKNLDLRLALCTKSALTALTDDEMHSIRNLVDSAILDREVKGGARWSLGKSCSGDRYRVIGIWHTEFKSYTSPSLKLKVRHADRYDFKTSTGEATIEVTLKLKGTLSEVQEGKVDVDSAYDVFKDNLKLIWDHFLPCEQLLM